MNAHSAQPDWTLTSSIRLPYSFGLQCALCAQLTRPANKISEQSIWRFPSPSSQSRPMASYRRLNRFYHLLTLRLPAIDLNIYIYRLYLLYLDSIRFNTSMNYTRVEWIYWLLYSVHEWPRYKCVLSIHRCANTKKCRPSKSAGHLSYLENYIVAIEPRKPIFNRVFPLWSTFRTTKF